MIAASVFDTVVSGLLIVGLLRAMYVAFRWERRARAYHVRAVAAIERRNEDRMWAIDGARSGRHALTMERLNAVRGMRSGSAGSIRAVSVQKDVIVDRHEEGDALLAATLGLRVVRGQS